MRNFRDTTDRLSLGHGHDHNISRQRAPVCSELTTLRKMPHGVAALEWRTIMKARGRRLCQRPTRLVAKRLNGRIHQPICESCGTPVRFEINHETEPLMKGKQA